MHAHDAGEPHGGIGSHRRVVRARGECGGMWGLHGAHGGMGVAKRRITSGARADMGMA